MKIEKLNFESMKRGYMKDLSNENVIHKKQNGIEYLQFRRLLEYPELQHCYTIRKKNIDFRIYEDDKILQESYDKICSILHFDRENIVKPHQTHTDRVEKVQKSNEKFDEVDGVITDKFEITLCTTSADCTSLLFYDPVKKVVGDVHSGWRGTLQKIGKKAVEKMIEQYNCNPKDIICCICPHIHKCHFEVGEEVAKLFYDTFSYMENIEELIIKAEQKVNYTEKQKNIQKYYIDTTKINNNLLQEIGLKKENIIDSGICTVCEVEEFHSYRVDKENSGRNGAMIMMKK